MSNHERQEPVLLEDEAKESSAEVEPLLLSKLLREGLPAPLWRRSQANGPGNGSEESINTVPDAAPSENPPSTTATEQVANIDVTDHAPEQSPPSTASVDTDLALILDRMRSVSFRYSAATPVMSELQAKTVPQNPAPEHPAPESTQESRPEDDATSAIDQLYERVLLAVEERITRQVQMLRQEQEAQFREIIAAELQAHVPKILQQIFEKGLTAQQNP